MDSNPRVNKFLKEVLKEYKNENHKDSQNKVYELLKREKVYLESRKWDEEKISELEAENVLLKEKIKELTEKEGKNNSYIYREKEINYSKMDRLEEEIEYLQDICKDLEKKKMTKQLKIVENKLKKLKERLSKGLLP